MVLGPSQHTYNQSPSTFKPNQKIEQKPIMHRKMYVTALALYLLAWIADAYQQPLNLSDMKPDSGGGSSPSIFIPITGNVYPLGYYTVKISIGDDNPPKYSYVLDVDTGSDLTWARCFENPTGNNYDPIAKKTVVTCGDPACKSLGEVKGVCTSPNDQCQYRVDYADGGSSEGVLVNESIPLTLTDGTTTAPHLTFGCEFPQEPKDRIHQPITDGVLGLGKGEPGILQQLSKMDVIRNVVGHCFSGQAEGGGYLFFGDLPIFGIVWKQISSNSKHYYLGSADILLDGQITDIRAIGITFDSGSTYTYFASLAYESLLDLITKNLKGQFSEADGDKTLPVCWQVPIEKIDNYFMTVALNFTDENNVIEFEMPPKSYLIINDKRNVCLGILNGAEIGLEDMNLIGDISMQNKLVIYDNERGMVGWAAVHTCNKNF